MTDRDSAPHGKKTRGGLGVFGAWFYPQLEPIRHHRSSSRWSDAQDQKCLTQAKSAVVNGSKPSERC